MGKLVLVLIIIVSKTKQDYIQAYNFNAKDLSYEGWTSNSEIGFTSCKGITLLGGYSLFNMKTKLSNVIRMLDPHCKYEKYERIDSWNNDTLRVNVDGFDQFSQSYQFGTYNNKCGLSQYEDQIDDVIFYIPHKKIVQLLKFTLLIKMETTMQRKSYIQETWGIQQFQVFIEKCNTDNMEDNNCIINDWKEVYSFILNYQYSDYEGWNHCVGYVRLNNAIFIHYHSYIQRSISLPEHQYLKISFFCDGYFDLYIDSEFIFKSYSNVYDYYTVYLTHTKTQSIIKFKGRSTCTYIIN